MKKVFKCKMCERSFMVNKEDSLLVTMCPYCGSSEIKENYEVYYNEYLEENLPSKKEEKKINPQPLKDKHLYFNDLVQPDILWKKDVVSAAVGYKDYKKGVWVRIGMILKNAKNFDFEALKEEAEKDGQAFDYWFHDVVVTK